MLVILLPLFLSLWALLDFQEADDAEDCCDEDESLESDVAIGTNCVMAWRILA